MARWRGQDWAADAAAELSGETVHSMIVQIIEKHCPFKPGVIAELREAMRAVRSHIPAEALEAIPILVRARLDLALVQAAAKHEPKET